MKHVTITVEFNISEKDYSSEDFQELKSYIDSGEFEKELIENNKFDPKDLKAELKTR